jgi:hypothetical protein
LKETCLQETGSDLQDSKSPGTCRLSRNFGGNARLMMEGSARQMQGCNDPPGVVVLGLVCTALQPQAEASDPGAGTGGGDAVAGVPAAPSPRPELSSCCP